MQANTKISVPLTLKQSNIKPSVQKQKEGVSNDNFSKSNMKNSATSLNSSLISPNANSSSSLKLQQLKTNTVVKNNNSSKNTSPTKITSQMLKGESLKNQNWEIENGVKQYFQISKETQKTYENVLITKLTKSNSPQKDISLLTKSNSTQSTQKNNFQFDMKKIQSNSPQNINLVQKIIQEKEKEKEKNLEISISNYLKRNPNFTLEKQKSQEIQQKSQMKSISQVGSFTNLQDVLKQDLITERRQTAQSYQIQIQDTNNVSQRSQKIDSKPVSKDNAQSTQKTQVGFEKQRQNTKDMGQYVQTQSEMSPQKNQSESVSKQSEKLNNTNELKIKQKFQQQTYRIESKVKKQDSLSQNIEIKIARYKQRIKQENKILKQQQSIMSQENKLLSYLRNKKVQHIQKQIQQMSNYQDLIQEIVQFRQTKLKQRETRVKHNINSRMNREAPKSPRESSLSREFEEFFTPNSNLQKKQNLDQPIQLQDQNSILVDLKLQDDLKSQSIIISPDQSLNQSLDLSSLDVSQILENPLLEQNESLNVSIVESYQGNQDLNYSIMSENLFNLNQDKANHIKNWKNLGRKSFNNMTISELEQLNQELRQQQLNASLQVSSKSIVKFKGESIKKS